MKLLASDIHWFGGSEAESPKLKPPSQRYEFESRFSRAINPSCWICFVRRRWRRRQRGQRGQRVQMEHGGTYVVELGGPEDFPHYAV